MLYHFCIVHAVFHTRKSMLDVLSAQAALASLAKHLATRAAVVGFAVVEMGPAALGAFIEHRRHIQVARGRKPAALGAHAKARRIVEFDRFYHHYHAISLVRRRASPSRHTLSRVPSSHFMAFARSSTYIIRLLLTILIAIMSTQTPNVYIPKKIYITNGL